MQKRSHQRELILQVIKNTKTHPTAAMVYDMVRAIEPTVSLATVYRNLALLRDAGELISFKTADGVEHFDGDTAEHQHFCCSNCGIIYDAFFTLGSGLKEQMEQHTGGTVAGYDLLFYGKCKTCNAVK